LIPQQKSTPLDSSSVLLLYEDYCPFKNSLIKSLILSTGFGQRFSALIVELASMAGNSRGMIRSFCSPIFGVSISQPCGAIQKIIDRAAQAIKPHYEAIADKARASRVNHLDETPWHKVGCLNWLWVMANAMVCFFMVHTRLPKKAFEELIGAWEGILVSDDYAVYRKWVNARQTCLSHHIRKAKALSESTRPELSTFGTWARKELQRQVKMANAPHHGEWRAFYARLCCLIALYRDSKSASGTFARRLEEEMDTLFTFLANEGVEPTNNFAERTIRFGVLWRKRNQGTKATKATVGGSASCPCGKPAGCTRCPDSRCLYRPSIPISKSNTPTSTGSPAWRSNPYPVIRYDSAL
jgi:transposase